MTRKRRLALFALPTVLYPGARLPLQVFETRYSRHHTVELFKTLLRSLSEPALESPRLDSRRDVSFDIASAIEIDPVWHQDLLELRSERRRLKRIDNLIRGFLEAGQNDEADTDQRG